jgi:hypothetical protein
MSPKSETQPNTEQIDSEKKPGWIQPNPPNHQQPNPPNHQPNTRLENSRNPDKVCMGVFFYNQSHKFAYFNENLNTNLPVRPYLRLSRSALVLVYLFC